jgi:hypothetical protein
MTFMLGTCLKILSLWPASKTWMLKRGKLRVTSQPDWGSRHFSVKGALGAGQLSDLTQGHLASYPRNKTHEQDCLGQDNRKKRKTKT